MRSVVAVALLLLLGRSAQAENDFQVTGTPIPPTLLRQNYGRVPKGIGAFDLNICNATATKQSLVSGEVFQALAGQTASLQPIGRDIMLGSILRSESHSPIQTLSIVLEATTGVLSLIGASRYAVSPALLTGIALASVTGQQIIGKLRPLLTGNQLEKFEAQVLEPAMVLDGGSCVERTVFVIDIEQLNGKARTNTPAHPLSFHIH
jgi:hypothetical protein